jgi:hypothetical protein
LEYLCAFSAKCSLFPLFSTIENFQYSELASTFHNSFLWPPY